LRASSIAQKFPIVEGSQCRNHQTRTALSHMDDTGAFVSDLAVRASAKPCPRCKALMQEVLRIAPAQNDPGLIAYECPSPAATSPVT
jgi:hypothetical protein